MTSFGLDQEEKLLSPLGQTEADIDELTFSHKDEFEPASEDFKKDMKNCDPVPLGLNSLNLSCFFCAAEFTTGGLLTLHTSGHTGEKLLTCLVCKKSFNLDSELVNHECRSIKHPQSRPGEPIPDDKICCCQCGEEFSSREDLNLHLRLHMRRKLFTCSICNTICIDRDALILHMRLHTRQTQFTCHVCGKDFAWRRHLTKHMEVHRKRKKVFRCKVCGAEFYTYYLLSKHKGVHQTLELPPGQTETNVKEEADDGDKSAKSESDLLKETNIKVSVSFKADNDFLTESSQHLLDSTSKRPKHDRQTDEKMSLITNIQKERKQEDSKPPPIKVEEEETEIVGFSLSPVSMKTEEDEEKPPSVQLPQPQTEQHKNPSEGEPVKTERTSEVSESDTDDSDCWKPKTCSNSGSDSGRNPSSCSENKPQESLEPESDDSIDSDFWKDCQKPQSSSNPARQEPLEKGVKYVTDLKPYSCPQCSKVFRYNSYLKIHMQQHTERYFCSICGHRSTSSSNLKVHVRTHTGEKPFSCSVCDKKYTNKASMLSHMSVHDAERKYSCDKCKKSFAWFTELKYHQCAGESSVEQTHVEDASINLKRQTLYS